MSEFNLKIELENLAASRKKEIASTKFPYKMENLRRFSGKLVWIYYVRIVIMQTVRENTMDRQERIYYKLGITSRDVKVRVKEIENDITARYEEKHPQAKVEVRVEIIDTARFEGRRAVLIEGFLHRRLGRYKVKRKVLSEGNSEVYVRDIFDRENNN